MKTRVLTEFEKSDLLKIYANEPLISLKEALFFFGGSLVLSIPFAIVFFLIALFVNHEPMAISVKAGGAGLIVGPCVLLIIAIHLMLRPKPFADIRKEIIQGTCYIKSYKLVRCFNLIDEGNDSEPDVLAEIENHKVIAIPYYKISSDGPVKNLVRISYLPSSKIEVGITFDGDVVKSHGDIITDNLWRNDDLPYLKPIPIRKLPSEAALILNSSR